MSFNKEFKIIRIFFAVFFAIFAIRCGSSLTASDADSKAKNIILFIGDGMGAEHRKAACWITVGNSGRLAMDDMPHSGWAHTSSADHSVTDSAAASTAMATGFKTNNAVIGLNANLKAVPTILEEAKAEGKMVGLVTTTQITHATPAAFAAHVEDRGLMTVIAEQMLLVSVDVMLGGGEDEFLPLKDSGCFPEPGERNDGRNLIEEAVSSGYTYVCDPVSFTEVAPSSTYRLLGLFADEGMMRPFSPSLAEMTQKAIDILSKNSNGFFLMVEGGQIDWASHANDAANAIADTVGLDEAVKVAKKFAAINKNTLIIVTADHETGGMTLSLLPRGSTDEDGPFSMPDGKQFYVNWSTQDHTATDVPVTSQGPLSDRLTGFYENTFIHAIMCDAMDAS